MFTLNRVTTIGVGAGLVLMGCASPVEETDDPTAQASAALTEEAVVDEAAEGISDSEEADAVVPAGIASAFEIPDARVPAPASDEAMADEDEDEDDPNAEKQWLGGLGWGGGFGRGLGWGGLGWGGLGWGGLGGVGYGYASPWGFGYSRAIGYGYPGYGGFFW